MRHERGAGTVAALIALCAFAYPARAADLSPAGAETHRPQHVAQVHRHWIALPPERHVIEVVRHAYSTHFIINGIPFAGQSACSFGWVAGQQVRLLAGSWHGACAQAVFYNVLRHQTCTLWCPSAARAD